LDAILHFELAVLYFPFRQMTPTSAGTGEITRIAAVKTSELGDTATELRAGLRALSALPIGSVIAFWGQRADLRANYELCDGEEVTTSDSPVLKQHKPDLRDSFVKGSNKDTKMLQLTQRLVDTIFKTLTTDMRLALSMRN
jgi:hypothetical protein